MKYNDNGTWKDIYVKTLDSLPTGAVIDYDGDTLPDGWVEAPSYSTDEVKTGDTWVDGKPIYRKVFEFTTGTGIKTLQVGDVKNFVRHYGTNGAGSPVPYATQTSGWQVEVYCSGQGTSNGVVNLSIGSNHSTGGTWHYVVEYTKN